MTFLSCLMSLMLLPVPYFHFNQYSNDSHCLSFSFAAVAATVAKIAVSASSVAFSPNTFVKVYLLNQDEKFLSFSFDQFCYLSPNLLTSRLHYLLVLKY